MCCVWQVAPRPRSDAKDEEMEGTKTNVESLTGQETEAEQHDAVQPRRMRNDLLMTEAEQHIAVQDF